MSAPFHTQLRWVRSKEDQSLQARCGDFYATVAMSDEYWNISIGLATYFGQYTVADGFAKSETALKHAAERWLFKQASKMNKDLFR